MERSDSHHPRFHKLGADSSGSMLMVISSSNQEALGEAQDKRYRRPVAGRRQSYQKTDLRNYITASLSSFAARKATFLLALMWMVSPVAGLRPSRAARLRTCRMPSPPMRMRSPFLRCLVTRLTRSPSTASVCFFDISWFSAKLAARCFIVTVGADFLAGAAMDDPPGCRKWPPGPPITMVA